MGADKATLAAGESTLLQSLVTRFAEMGQVIVVLRQGQDVDVPGASTVHDIHPNAGPLGGLHTGLSASPDVDNFLLACDMPFAEPGLARYVLSRLGDHDASVPVLARRPEPLFAAYKQCCLPVVESCIRAGALRMRDALDRLDVLYIPESDLRPIDPQLRSFVNVNTPEEYEREFRV